MPRESEGTNGRGTELDQLSGHGTPEAESSGQIDLGDEHAFK